MDRKLVGQRLKKLRDGRNREVVAKELGISLSALKKYETGERFPLDKYKVIIADYYGVTVQELFFDTSEHVLCPE